MVIALSSSWRIMSCLTLTVWSAYMNHSSLSRGHHFHLQCEVCDWNVFKIYIQKCVCVKIMWIILTYLYKFIFFSISLEVVCQSVAQFYSINVALYFLALLFDKSIYTWIINGKYCVAGSVLGGIAGLVSLSILKFSGMTMEEVRYWQYQWKEDRNR